MLVVAKVILILLSGVAVFIAAASGIAWFWLSRESIPNRIQPAQGLSFDYVIVGAGTAGSVVAHELSRQSNYSILLIEAGDVFNPLSKVPLLATLLQRSQADWQFKSVPQKHSSFGLTNHIQLHPRGKGLGGSAQINFMLHFTGNQRDFDTWKKLGITGWSLRPAKSHNSAPSCFAKSSRNTIAQCRQNSKYKLGYDSNKNDTKIEEIWTVPKNYSAISEAFVDAGSKHFKNAGLQFRLSKYNIKNGIRWSVFERFLRPIFARNNIKILTNAIVKKVVVVQDQQQPPQATAVLVANPENPNQKFEIFARREVVLSAGAFQTPQLLQVSGIGPKHLLDTISVRQVLNSKNVGRNLHDHFHLPLFVSINATASITVRKILSAKEIVKYLLRGKGHFSNFGVMGSITADNDSFAITVFGTGAVDERALMDISNFEREDFRSLFPLYHNTSQEGFVLISSCYQPISRGTVMASSSNIDDPPLIDPRYLQSQHDVDCMIRAVRMAVRLIESPPFRQINAKLHWPKIKACSNYGPLNRDFYTNQPSDKYLECLMRRVALTGHHPGGTCSMGASGDSVLDNQLRLRGIDRLRVVDASVLPIPVSGTPNSVLVSIAKRAAKLILKDAALW